jgi:type II secretory ATPase GspE/PulE/Tfp pilus assembly ATPase PilB-like protein
VLDGGNKKIIKYDYVGADSVSQEQFYRSTGISDNVRRLFEGFSSTVLAYGPTGSGKTYTMQGPNEKNAVGQLCNRSRQTRS